jgi:hypothetical protein
MTLLYMVGFVIKYAFIWFKLNFSIPKKCMSGGDFLKIVTIKKSFLFQYKVHLKPFNFCLKTFFLSLVILTIRAPKRKNRFSFKGVFCPLKVRMGTYKKIRVPYFGLDYNIFQSHPNRRGTLM